MAKLKEDAEKTVTLTSPYGSKVTVSASKAATFQAAGYAAEKQVETAAQKKAREAKEAKAKADASK